ncbi:MAG: tetratricopeptide repeat protein, partial [Spirochaetaceae bacterium]|nr:tetratricopeptide repeat protein [Spirochaetaceae bacterium]
EALSPGDDTLSLPGEEALSPSGDDALSPGDDTLSLSEEALSPEDDTLSPEDEALSPPEGEESAEDASDGFDDFSIPDFDGTDDPLLAETAEASPEEFADGALAGEESLGGEEPPGEESFELGGEASQDALSDSFDSFNPDGSSADFGMTDADLSLDATTFSEPGDMDEFSLSGVDDVLADTAPRAAQSGTRPRLEASGDVEEIQLSQEELEKLEATLASYPLNLRIACEELIAEQAVAPDMMSALIKKLTGGAPPRETASLAGKILGRAIPIPRGFEKKSGAELEAEQASFAYIFVHNFLPIFRIVALCGLLLLSVGYLVHQFIIVPIQADNTYKRGYSRIEAGDYTQANVVFEVALRIRRIKKWFFRYAEGFRDARQYLDAEKKYDQLLYYYPRDKQGALDYADLETNYLMNYQKADAILRHNILDYSLDDREGLLARGDNQLAWGDNGMTDDGKELPPEEKAQHYEAARNDYARLMERYGEKDEYLERMLKFFIRTDQLGQVLPLQLHFMANRRSKISAVTLTELSGYLLDKRLEETSGVPDENISRIEGLRDLLLRAINADPAYPEAHYQLSRYYSHYGSTAEERRALENAVRAFDISAENSRNRISNRIETQRRYAWLLTLDGELFPAEEQLVKGINIFEDALRRNLLSRSPRYGRIYADLGDLEYFKKDGNMAAALRYYDEAERSGWAPPEILYRTGAAHYQRQEWQAALEKFFAASSAMPFNRRILYALGNASFQRGDYYAAEGYYTRLLDILDAERNRFPLLQPQERPEHMELAERLMVLRNNLGVTMDALAGRTGNPAYRPRALALYAESARAWDALTRDSRTMVRMSPENSSGPGLNLAFLNSQYSLHPVPDFSPEIYTHIDKDVLEASIWERIAPPAYGLSAAIPFQVRDR